MNGKQAVKLAKDLCNVFNGVLEGWKIATTDRAIKIFFHALLASRRNQPVVNRDTDAKMLEKTADDITDEFIKLVRAFLWKCKFPNATPAAEVSAGGAVTTTAAVAVATVQDEWICFDEQILCLALFQAIHKVKAAKVSGVFKARDP
jgi:hypothetical protein